MRLNLRCFILVLIAQVGGLSLFSAEAATAPSFDEQVGEGVKGVRGAVARMKEARAVSAAADPAPATDALDKTIRAHATTWTTLLILDQFDEVFCDAGKIKVVEFPVWGEQRIESRAQHLAAAMDDIFVRFRGAERKAQDAPDKLAKVLDAAKNDGKNVRWLADQIAGLYRFWGEKAP